uniref:Dolichol kinase n=1 Tax=Panagrolaimus sp. JU765 TaxID=591449 RepID=A0AC34QAP3_9BILA
MEATAEFIDESLIVSSWTSTIAFAVIAGSLFGEGKRKLRGIWLNLVLAAVVLAAFINLSFRVNKPIMDLPYYCYLRVWDATTRRACLLLFFVIQLVSSLAFCSLQTLKSKKASTIHRKFFHLTLLMIALAGLLFDPRFVRLSAHLMLQIFIILEILRIFKATPWSHLLDSSLPTFIDPAQESEALILTPILLIAGIFLPIFLSPINFEQNKVLELKHLAGIATVGIGDSLAAIIGSKFGRTRLSWPFRGHKSLEGALAMFVGQFIFYSAILAGGIVPYTNFDLFRLVLAVIVCTLIEAASKIGDNILLPFAAWVIL